MKKTKEKLDITYNNLQDSLEDFYKTINDEIIEESDNIKNIEKQISNISIVLEKMLDSQLEILSIVKSIQQDNRITLQKDTQKSKRERKEEVRKQDPNSISLNDRKIRDNITEVITEQLTRNTHEEIIMFVKRKYNIRLPKVAQKRYLIQYTIDTSIQKEGITLFGMPTIIDELLDPIEVRRILNNRHKFPNRNSLLFLAEKLGIYIDKNVGKGETIEIIINAKFSSLHKWYQIIRDSGGVDE